MARYRVGDRFLSQEEYDQENDVNLMIFFFFIGFIIAGIVCFSFIKTVDVPKPVQFLAILTSAVTTGVLLAKLRNIIVALFLIAIVLSLIAGVSSCVWNML